MSEINRERKYNLRDALRTQISMTELFCQNS